MTPALRRCRRRLVLAAMLGLACPVRAQPTSAARELKLSTALGPAYPQGKAGEAWARLIAERSGGHLAAKHFPGSALVQRDPVREFAALRDGAIDLAVGSAANWSFPVRELNLVALPWLFADQSALERALAGEVGARLSKAVEAAGAIPVAIAPGTFQQLATSRAVHAPSDLKGLRLRAPVSRLHIDTLLALGALPAGMSASDGRLALARGGLDGEVLGVAAFGAARLYANGAAHLLVWDAFADALIFAVNAELWSALSPANCELVREAASDAALEANALARAQTDDAALARLAREGTNVTRLTPAGKGPFRDQTRATYQRWSAIVGEDLVRAAEAAAR